MQKAEELIKKEMLTMISYDLVNPVQQPTQKIPQSALNRAHNWLQHHPYDDISEEDLEEVKFYSNSIINSILVILSLPTDLITFLRPKNL